MVARGRREALVASFRGINMLHRPQPAVAVARAFPVVSQPVTKRPDAWKITAPVLNPGPKGTFDDTSVKDPSVVRHGGMWHVFYTARGGGRYSMGYAAVAEWEDLDAAPRHRLDSLCAARPYVCAPQAFYLSTQGLWYLVFQTDDEFYAPEFATSPDLSPDSWSAPETLLGKDDEAKWIDFWTIFDERHAYLYYTQDHWDVVVRKTTREEFPGGWGLPTTILSGVHEAVHVYRAGDEYHLFYEMKGDDRWFGMARAAAPGGPWEIVADRYAAGSMLKGHSWTDMVSHGEILRCGNDEYLEYDAENPRWLIQGLQKEDYREPYAEMPWRLGLIEGTCGNALRVPLD